MKQLLLTLSIFLSIHVSSWSQEVIKEWNFTKGSPTSEDGTTLKCFSEGNQDDGSDDQLYLDHEDFYEGVKITPVGEGKFNLQVTLSDFNLPTGKHSFIITLKDQNDENITRLNFHSNGNNMIRVGGDDNTIWYVGDIQYGIKSKKATTYGITLDFNKGKGAYQYWLDTPDSKDTAWKKRNKEYKGSISLKNREVSKIVLSVKNQEDGNYINLDQIKMWKS